MKSVFDPSFQNTDISSKIVFALERLSQVFRINLWQENKKHNLSPLQMQILLFLNFQNVEQRTVSSLAQEFNLTKATISEAVKTLAHKGYVAKKKDPGDKRSYLLHLTARGQHTALDVSTFANDVRRLVLALPEERKEVLLTTLLEIIDQLQQDGHISMQRMCFSCRHFRRQENGESSYYCNLLQTPLQNRDLRLNCLEHEPVS